MGTTAPGVRPPTTPGLSEYLKKKRGPTTLDELRISWEYPTHIQALAPSPGGTVAPVARHALPEDDVFASLAKGDRRPLLVLRECLRCNGTDNALLQAQADNERTLLMTRWFHCVKLPPDVLADDHPFHALFAGEKPAHLFLARWDGSERQDLSGEQSRTELWELMEERLAREYVIGPQAALKGLLPLCDQLDQLDVDIDDAKQRLDRAQVEDGPESAKASKWKKRLADLKDERNQALARMEELSRIGLKPAPAEAPTKS